MPLGFTGGLAEISARYGQTLVRGLEQSGAMLERGLQQMQTNRQLREFGNVLSTVSPESPEWPKLAIGLAGNFPLAMQDPRGQAMVAIGAKANANWMQSQNAMQRMERREEMFRARPTRATEATIGSAWGEADLPDAGGSLTTEPGAGALFGGTGDTAPSPPAGFSERAGGGRFSFGANGNEEAAPQELAPLPDTPAAPDKVQAFRGSLLRNSPGLKVSEGERKVAQYAKEVQRDADAEAKPKPSRWISFGGVAINPETKETITVPERPMTAAEKAKIEGAEKKEIARMDTEEKNRMTTALKAALSITEKDVEALSKTITKHRDDKTAVPQDVYDRHKELVNKRAEILQGIADLAKSVKTSDGLPLPSSTKATAKDYF